MSAGRTRRKKKKLAHIIEITDRSQALTHTHHHDGRSLRANECVSVPGIGCGAHIVHT